MPLPYYKQEQDHTCGAAVARMVVNGLLNTDESEDFYAALLKTNDQVGTQREWFDALNNLPSIECKTGTHATLQTLQQLIDEHYSVALLYILHTPDDAPVGHWAVLNTFNENTITLQDPWMGEAYELALPFFLNNWHSDPALCDGVKDPSPWVAIKKK
jgi:ABC-type bacteriocin/lantibiotic exporter with double-glycine peptidase domain